MRFGKLTLFFLFLSVATVCAAPSPWDSWRAGYTTYEMGEQWREKGNYTEALARFQKAKRHYLAVRSARPDWNQRVIAERIAECDRQIAEMERLLKGGAAPVSPAAQSAPSSRRSAAPSVSGAPSSPAAGTDGGDSHADSQWQALRTERDELRRQVASLKAEVIPLRERENIQRKLEAEIASMLRDRRIDREKIALLEARCRTLESAAAKPDQTRDALEKQLLAERMRAETAEKKAAAATAELQQTQTTLQQTEAAKSAAEKVLRRTQDECRRLTAKAEDVQTLEGAVARLKEENAKLLARIDAETKQHRAALDEALAKEQKARSEREAAETAAAGTIRELRQKVALLTEKLTTAGQEGAASAALTAEIRDLQRRYQELLAEKEALTAAGKKRQQEMETAWETCRSELQKTTSLLGEKEREITSLNATVASLTEVMQKNASRLQKEESSARTLLQETEKLRAEAESREKELLTLRSKVAALEADLREYSARAASLQQRLTTRESESFQSAAAANETCRKLERDLLALQQELAAKKAESDSLQEQLAERERLLKGLQAELLAERAKAIEAQDRAKQLAEAAEKSAEYEKQLSELRKNFEALAAENRENRLLAEAAKPREAELSSIRLRLLEMDALKRDLLKEQQINEELRDSLRKASADSAALRKAAAELDTARRALARLEAAEKELLRLKELQKQYDRLAGREKEFAALKIRLDEIVSRNQQLSLALDEQKAIAADLTKQLALLTALRQENERLKQQLLELKELSGAQGKELTALHEQISRTAAPAGEQIPAETMRELESLRQAVKKLAPLNDEISRLHAEQEVSRMKLEELSSRLARLQQNLLLRENEIARLQKLNRELADFRATSSAALREKADEARQTRLAAEIQALQKLNASLSAERDRLQRRIEEMEQGLTLPADGQSAPSASPEELASSGAIAEAEGKTESAIWNYRQALAADPSFLPAQERLGKLLYRKGRFAEALPHLSAARAARIEDLDLAILTIHCQISLKRFGNARTILEPLLKKNPENSRLQLAAGAICAASGEQTQAEERFITAARLAPADPEPLLALARLLAAQSPERGGEAVAAYEKARDLGAAPDPQLEKALGKMLDQRRETVRFFFSAAQEAEISGDWLGAIWYYQKLLDIGREDFIPHLAFAHWKSGKPGKAREILEFHTPSPLSMAVLCLIELSENQEEAALLAARRTAGAKKENWTAMALELQKLAAQPHPSASVRMLLVNLGVRETGRNR